MMVFMPLVVVLIGYFCLDVIGNWHMSSNWVKEVLSVLMLCMPVFIFTSGSSALLGRPHCGLSICQYLPYSIHFSEFISCFLFYEKTDKTRKYSKSAWPPMVTTCTCIEH